MRQKLCKWSLPLSRASSPQEGVLVKERTAAERLQESHHHSRKVLRGCPTTPTYLHHYNEVFWFVEKEPQVPNSEISSAYTSSCTESCPSIFSVSKRHGLRRKLQRTCRSGSDIENMGLSRGWFPAIFERYQRAPVVYIGRMRPPRRKGEWCPRCARHLYREERGNGARASRGDCRRLVRPQFIASGLRTGSQALQHQAHEGAQVDFASPLYAVQYNHVRHWPHSSLSLVAELRLQSPHICEA